MGYFKNSNSFNAPSTFLLSPDPSYPKGGGIVTQKETTSPTRIGMPHHNRKVVTAQNFDLQWSFPVRGQVDPIRLSKYPQNHNRIHRIPSVSGVLLSFTLDVPIICHPSAVFKPERADKFIFQLLKCPSKLYVSQVHLLLPLLHLVPRIIWQRGSTTQNYQNKPHHWPILRQWYWMIDLRI